jgi:hypothetical protein
MAAKVQALATATLMAVRFIGCSIVSPWFFEFCVPANRSRMDEYFNQNS